MEAGPGGLVHPYHWGKLIILGKASVNQDPLPVLKGFTQDGKPPIIAEDIEREALATRVVNKIRGIFKSVAVKASGSGDHRMATPP